MAQNINRKKVTSLSSEEFFSQGFDSDVLSDDESAPEDKLNVSEKREKLKPKSHHKDALSKLQENDPEFFNFLKENDQELLEFDESDDSFEDESDESGSEQSAEIDKDTKTKAESDDDKEAENDKEFIREGETITLEMLTKLKKGLQKNSLCSLRKVMRIFHAAVAEAAEADEKKSSTKLQYRIYSSSVFNGLIQICLKSVATALSHHLASEKPKKGKKAHLPSTSVHWSKVKVTVKCYLQDLLQLLRQFTEQSMLIVLLKHAQDLCLYYACFPKIAKMLIKRLVRMWCSAEEHIRVVSFLSIRKMALLMPLLFDFILKQLYLGYVKNAKFVTPKTKPVVVFMQNSLVEMFSMDHALTYQYGFVYVRQMAIHLRNAISLKKMDSYQSVYNWQYISCIQLWSRVLGELHGDTLAPLIYPLVQIVLGVIRLIPTARYYPLRFHCLRSLNNLAKATNTYIPVASYLIEILESDEFNKKIKPSTASAPDFSCILKSPKAQMHSKSFQNSVIDQICCLLLEHFVTHSTSIALPELIFPICLRMKRFMKKTEVAKLSKQIKQVVDKLQEAGHEVSRKRSAVNFSPKDLEEVKKWEIAYSLEKNSLQKFYATWLKMKEIADANLDPPIDDEIGDNSSDEEEKPKRKRKKPSTSSFEEKKSRLSEKLSTQNGLVQEAEDLVENFEMSSDEE